ncbi:MAG: hypothetical protein M3347_04240, partial [Armatimonadota bacterium]|nr:hypothetical protein [Armatimonadota bacterium]
MLIMIGLVLALCLLVALLFGGEIGRQGVLIVVVGVVLYVGLYLGWQEAKVRIQGPAPALLMTL